MVSQAEIEKLLDGIASNSELAGICRIQGTAGPEEMYRSMVKDRRARLLTVYAELPALRATAAQSRARVEELTCRVSLLESALDDSTEMLRHARCVTSDEDDEAAIASQIQVNRAALADRRAVNKGETLP